jgi:hypothetical protein
MEVGYLKSKLGSIIMLVFGYGEKYSDSEK